MYCKFCGAHIEDNSTFCSYCGRKLSETNNVSLTQPNQNNSIPSETSNKSENPAQITAVIGFVLSFFFSLVGLIVSAIALKKYKLQESKEGHGLAVAGLILSIISVVFTTLYFLVLIAAVIVA